MFAYEEVVWVKVLCPETMELKPALQAAGSSCWLYCSALFLKKPKGITGFESKIFWTRTREPFLKKPGGFEPFESEPRIRCFTSQSPGIWGIDWIHRVQTAQHHIILFYFWVFVLYGSVTSIRVAPSDGIWNKFHASHWLTGKKGKKEFQYLAWNIFQMTSGRVKFRG